MYHDGSLHLQDHFDTRRLADRIEERLMRSTIGDDERAFIERLDMFFLATADAAGRPQCSYKGGDPGFVRVLDEHTLAFPSFDGNGMYLSLGNVRVNPHVGLLFIDFRARRPSRLRVNGIASSDECDPLLAEYPRRSSSSASTRSKSFRTARATSTGWNWSSARALSHVPAARRRFPTGSGRSGPSTYCPRAIQRRRRRQMSTPAERGYAIADREHALDFMADYPAYGEQRWYSDALGAEQVSFSWRRCPPVQAVAEATGTVIRARRRSTSSSLGP